MSYERYGFGLLRQERANDADKGAGMTKMVMMWLIGVPVSVLLLFMIFGVP